MELPFAVESPASGGAENNGRRNNSLQHSESDSLVTASSQGSFIESTVNTIDGDNHCGPLIPNTPQDILLPSRHHIPPQHRQQEQGQLVVIPGSQEHTISIKDGRYGDPENDFTYVNVTEVDADEGEILIEGTDVGLSQGQTRGDVLAVLVGGMQENDSNTLLNETELAHEMAVKATEAKKQGDIVSALEYHTNAAKSYKDIASLVRDRNAPLASTLLLLSQTQAKSAIALKKIVKLNPVELRQILPQSCKDTSDALSSKTLSQKERLRAAVRGALSSRHPHEADLSDSQFLGNAGRETTGKDIQGQQRSTLSHNESKGQRKNNKSEHTRNDQEGTLLTEEQKTSNPVDEMMELERELRDMDMALELGNSISSLDSRMQNRMKNSMIGDGSFMVVPPGSSSYMASSIWGANHHANNTRQSGNNQHGTAGVRARANRVQNIVDASATPVQRPLHHQTQVGNAQSSSNRNTSGLESSWWGNTNTTSQILTSSVMSLGVRGIEGMSTNDLSGGQSTENTKQIMRLMDSLKTLGDENAVLLREVEELEAARAEAKSAREAMKRFKMEYGQRFVSLKKALEKFRQENPGGKNNANGPVNTSEFMKNATVSEQLQRQEQLIQKLTRELKKEKDESKKKDSALRKYESFYRDIKARSAQKAKQRQTQQQHLKTVKEQQ